VNTETDELRALGGVATPDYFTRLCHFEVFEFRCVWTNRQLLFGQQKARKKDSATKTQSGRGEALKRLDVMGIH